MMSFDEFKRILDQFDRHLHTVFFYFMGESFLNKDAYKMIKYASHRGLRVSACTNGNHVNPEELVRSGIDRIDFQIAGTTEETNAIYRVGGDLWQVLDNVEKTVQWRERLGRRKEDSPYSMKIGLGFILFKHNEHQVEDFVEMAKEIGVDVHQIIDPCVRTLEQGRMLLPSDRSHWIYDPEAFDQGNLLPRNPPDNYCQWIYGTVTIQVNGDVVACCRDTKGKWVLGNVFERDISQIWNGPAVRALRRAVGTRQHKMALCRLCEGYTVPVPGTEDRQFEG